MDFKQLVTFFHDSDYFSASMLLKIIIIKNTTIINLTVLAILVISYQLVAIRPMGLDLKMGTVIASSMNCVGIIKDAIYSAVGLGTWKYRLIRFGYLQQRETHISISLIGYNYSTYFCYIAELKSTVHSIDHRRM